MKKDTPHVIKRAQRFQVTLIGEGLLVVAVAGIVALLYRILLGRAEEWLNCILEFTKGSSIKTVLLPSNVIIAMTDERDRGVVHDTMRKLCAA